MTSELESSWESQQQFSVKNMTNGFDRLNAELELVFERLRKETEELRLDIRRTKRRDEANRIKIFLGCLVLWALITFTIIEIMNVDLPPISAFFLFILPVMLISDISDSLKKLVDA